MDGWCENGCARERDGTGLTGYKTVDSYPAVNQWFACFFDSEHRLRGPLEARDDENCGFRGDEEDAASFVQLSTTSPEGFQAADIVPWGRGGDEHWVIGIGRTGDSPYEEEIKLHFPLGQDCAFARSSETVSALNGAYFLRELVLMEPASDEQAGRILAIGHGHEIEDPGYYAELSLEPNAAPVIANDGRNFNAEDTHDWTMLGSDDRGPVTAHILDIFDNDGNLDQQRLSFSKDAIFPVTSVVVSNAAGRHSFVRPSGTDDMPGGDAPFAFSLIWTLRSPNAQWSTYLKHFEDCF